MITFGQIVLKNGLLARSGAVNQAEKTIKLSIEVIYKTEKKLSFHYLILNSSYMKQKTFILSKKKSFTASAISCCMFSVRIRDSSALSEIRPFNLKNRLILF